MVMMILIWHESQRVPASRYGDAHAGEGGFTIAVCQDQETMNAARSANPDAIVYHFTGSSSGGGRQ
jgi:hypothetical protein